MHFHPTDYFTSIAFSYYVLIPLFGWFLPLTKFFFTTIFLVTRNFPLRNFPQFQHICNVFFGVFLPVWIYFSSAYFPSNALLPSIFFSSFGEFFTTDHFSILNITVIFTYKLSHGTVDYSFFRLLRHLPVYNI